MEVLLGRFPQYDMKRIVELCKFCKLYLGILLVDGEPCCQFCAEELKKKESETNPDEG